MKTKKYITTDKHPELKEGVIFKEEGINMYFSNETRLFMSEFYSNLWASNNWIKEVQEPEYTRDDMIELIEHYNCVAMLPIVDSHDVFMNWKNSKE